MEDFELKGSKCLASLAAGRAPWGRADLGEVPGTEPCCVSGGFGGLPAQDLPRVLPGVGSAGAAEGGGEGGEVGHGVLLSRVTPGLVLWLLQKKVASEIREGQRLLTAVCSCQNPWIDLLASSQTGTLAPILGTQRPQSHAAPWPQPRPSVLAINLQPHH